MEKEKAIEILQQALNNATLKGVFNLSDTAVIIQALNKLDELVEIVPTEE
jgi:ferric-dicitrate binding protein FerR (iron transport regulator)